VRGPQTRSFGSDVPSAAPVVWEALDGLPVGIAVLSSDHRVLRANAWLGALLGLVDPCRPAVTFRGLGLDLSASSPQHIRWHDGNRELLLRMSLSEVSCDDPEASRLAVVVDVTSDGPQPVSGGVGVPRSRTPADVGVPGGSADGFAGSFASGGEPYRILADHSADIVLVHRDETIEWVSPSVETILGRDPRALIGCTLAELTVTQDAENVPSPPRPGESITYRLRLRAADGSLRWFQARVTAQRPFNRQKPFLYTSLRDIDEQVRVESALKESERMLRRAFDASPDGWAIMAAERHDNGEVVRVRAVWINPAGLRDTGKAEDEAVGLEVSEVLPQGKGEEFLRLSALALDSDLSVPTQIQTDGEAGRRVFEGFLAGLDSTTLLCSWRDVTERIQAQELLNRAYEETAEMRVTLQTALDATSDAFAVYALEWDEWGELMGMRVVHANTAGAESLGLTAEEMVGRELREVFPQAEETGLWERIVIAAVTKEPQHHRVQLHDDDGTWMRALDNTVAPVGEERMTITWRDVSNEERAIRQLARTRDEAMYSATHDALTDLPNRVLVHQHLREALASCRPDERIGVVFVDLDRFKEINDSYGHAAGDIVLKETASRLGKLVRHGDLAARLAGDEFILVLTGLPPDWSSEQFFARAQAVLEEPVWAEIMEISPSASLGVVLADPRRHGIGVDELIKRADAEMYHAKAARRR
jgi:diguanylate cyclase (GGDEF)-like protein/PAS domain S-box-containing protein